MKVILVDGVKYELWTPKAEAELERIVEEHAEDVFGKQSMYFKVKKKLESKSKIGSIPDGYVVTLEETPVWHIVEVELSSHPLYEHIVSQMSKFINGIKNLQSQKVIADAIYEEIDRDDFLKIRLKKAIGTTEIHKFLSDLLMTPPMITVIIEKDTEQLREALQALAYQYQRIKVVEFQTFARTDIGMPVHAHLFEPPIEPPHPPPNTIENALEITLSNPTCINFHLFFIPKEKRGFFPGYKIPFKLQTDIGILETWVSSAPKGTDVGDPQAGVYVQRDLANWYRAHPELKVGSKIIVEAIEPMKLYRLRRA